MTQSEECFSFEYGDGTMELDDRGTPKQGFPKRSFIHALLPHLQGVRHPDDEEDDEDTLLRLYNPFGIAFRRVALGSSYEPVVDISNWKQLFDSAMDDDLETFQLALESMGSPRNPDALQPAACLAAQFSHFRILRYCFEQGAKFDVLLEAASRVGVKTREMWDVLIEYDWRSIKTSTEAARSEIGKLKSDPDQEENVRYLQERCYPPDYDEWEHDPFNPKNFSKYTPEGFYSPQWLMKYMPSMA